MARHFNYALSLSIIILAGGVTKRDMLQITGGEVIPEIEMPVADTILNLKESIMECLDVDVFRQTLLFNGKELKNRRTIESYHFQPFATLDLVVAPLLGQPKFNILVKSQYREGNFRVRETSTVDYIKGKIERRWGLASQNLITLIRLSKEMEDDLPLSAYYVCENSEVEMIFNHETS